MMNNNKKKNLPHERIEMGGGLELPVVKGGGGGRKEGAEGARCLQFAVSEIHPSIHTNGMAGGTECTKHPFCLPENARAALYVFLPDESAFVPLGDRNAADTLHTHVKQWRFVCSRVACISSLCRSSPSQ